MGRLSNTHEIQVNPATQHSRTVHYNYEVHASPCKPCKSAGNLLECGLVMPASPFSGCCWPKRGKASVLSKQVLPPDPVCRQEEQGPGADAVPRPNPANLAQVLAQVPAISAYEQLRECCSLISGYGDLDYACVSGFSACGTSLSCLAATGRAACTSYLGGRPGMSQPVTRHVILELLASQKSWVITGPQPDDHDAHTTPVMQSYFLAPLRCRQGVVGLLILGHSKPQYFQHHSWEATGEVAAAWLSRFFVDGQLTNYCSTLHRISTCASLNDLVKVVSWTIMQQQLQALHQAPLQCRVALLRQDALCALLFDDLWHPLPDVEPAVLKKTSLHHDNMRSSTHSQGLHGGAGQSSSICKLTSRMSTGTQRNSGSQMLSSRLSTSHRIMGLVHKPHARDQQHQPTHTTSAVTELCHATALYGSVTGPLGPPHPLMSVPATAAIDMMTPYSPPCREWGLQHPCPGLAWHSTASQTQPSQPCQGPAGHALPPLPPIHGSLSTAPQPGLVSEAHGTYVPLTKTVLGEAVRWRSAVWISDCPAFMQNARNPNQDVYLASSQEAAGCMVVCPVYHQDKPFMALYLNMAQRYSTEVLQAVGQALNEICGVLQPAIWHLLHSELDVEWQYLQTQVLGGPESSSELQAGDRILLSAFASIAHSSTAPCLPRPPSVAKDSPRLGWAVEGQGQLAARAWGQDHEANSTEAAVQSSAAAMQSQQAVDQAHLPTSVLMQCIEEEMPSLVKPNKVSIHGNQPLPLRSTCTQPAPVILLANSTSAVPSPASGLCTRPAAGSEAPKPTPAAPLAPCTTKNVASGAGSITGQAPDAPTLHQASSPPSHIHEVPPKQLLASPLAQLVPEDLGLSTVPCTPLHGTRLVGLPLTASDSGSFSGRPCIRARGLDRTDSAPDQQPATCSQPALVAAGSLPDPLWPLPSHLPMHKSYSSELQQMLHTVLGKLPTATQPGEAGRLRKGLHRRGPWLNRDLKGTLLGLFKRESRSFNGRGQAVQVAQSVTHDTHEEPAVQRAASCTTHSSSASKANKQRLPSRWSLDPDRQAEAATPCVSSCAELTSRNTDTGSLETQGVVVADPPPFPASHLHGKPPLSSVDLSARPLLPGTAPHSPQDGSRKSNPALQRLLMSLPDLPSSTTHQWQAEVVPDSMQVKLAGSSSLKGVRRKTSFQVSRSPIASSSARRIGALISGLQDKVQEAQRYQLQARASFVRHEELSSISISAKIGAGGFGACYRALYQGAEVAIKVVHDRHGSATEVFRNAVELAVLSTLSHVNIVQVLTYFTDVGVSYPSIDEVLNGTSAPIHLHSAEELGALEATVQQQQQQHQAAGPQQQTLQDQQQQLTQDRLLVLYPEPTSQPLTTHTQKMRRALLICMEYCDMGTLADAMLRGTFHDNTSGSQPALPRWAAIYQTLLELALALRYLHSLSLVHRDVKLQNVLLKSNSNDPRGFICKLSDFGLVKLMSEKQSCLSSSSNVQLDTLLPAEPSPVESAELNLNFRPWNEVFASPRPEPGPQPVRKAPEVPCASRRARKAPAGSVFGIPVAPRRYSGTVTHLPPEAFGSGHGQVDPSIDIWAFGICMWELATGRTVYGELMSEAIILRAANPSMRPVFQSCVPQEYSQLAARCWDSDPNARPSAEELVQCLGDALAALRGTHTPPRRASSGQHASSLLLAQPALCSETHHARPSSQLLPASALPTAPLLSTSQPRLGPQVDRDVQGQPPHTHLVPAQAWLGMWPHTAHDRQRETSFMLWPHASGSSQRPVGGPSGAGWSKGSHAPLTPCDPSLTSLVQTSQTKQLRVGMEALQPAQSGTVSGTLAYQDQDLGYRPSSPQDEAWLGNHPVGNAGQPSADAQMEAGLQQPLQHAWPGLAHSMGGLSGITFDQARRTPSCCEERGCGSIMQHVRPWTPPTQDKPGEWDTGFPVHIL